MILPIDFWDVTLLFAMMSIVLLVTTGLSASSSKKSLAVNKINLKIITLIISCVFLVMIAIRIIYAFLTI